MKTLIAIPSCHALRHYQSVLRETWVKDIPAGVDCKFFLGSTPEAHIIHLPSNPYHTDEVYLDVPDDIDSLTKKVVAMIRWSLREGYEYLWKFDLDTLVRPSLLLNSGLEMHDWVGGQNSCGDNVIFASGGSGYGLSKKAMELVAGWPEKQTRAEDVHVAEAMINAGIALHSDSRFKFIPGQALESQDLSYHLSSVVSWSTKYQTVWMYEAYSSKVPYRPQSCVSIPPARRQIRLRRPVSNGQN